MQEFGKEPATEPVMDRSEERRLIARARKGQAEAFRALVDAYKDRLFAFVYRMSRNHHEAEDICQAAFVRAFESLKSYNDTYAFSTWLFTIAYRLGLNQMRRRRVAGSEAEFALENTASPECTDEVANTEEARRMRDLIWEAVGELSDPQKSAVLLFYRENKSCQEISEILGVPAVTVKSHLHRAREKLRTALSGQLTEDWAGLDWFGEANTA